MPTQAPCPLVYAIQPPAMQLQACMVAEGQQLLGKSQMQAVVVGLVVLGLEGGRLRQPAVARQVAALMRS